jgi:phage gpG-like protein
LKVRNKVKNPFPLLKLGATTYGFQDIIDHFRRESGPRGRWKRRKPSTQKSYERRKKTDSRYSPTNKLLQLTGNLRKSLLPEGGSLKRRGKFGIMLFTDIKYAGKHNKGDRARRIPRREFMWLSNRAARKMINLFARGLVKN